jgi:hypothetical protein
VVVRGELLGNDRGMVNRPGKGSLNQERTFALRALPATSQLAAEADSLSRRAGGFLDR